MEITPKIRAKLLLLFEGVNYRQIVAERAGCHPNTVSNVLHNGHSNADVALHLLQLGQEIKQKQEADKAQVIALAKQL